jgi:hypothetical protein
MTHIETPAAEGSAAGDGVEASNAADPNRRSVQKQSDAKLAAEIVHAMKEYDAADATRKEKAIAWGMLLVEAQKRHPSKAAFKKFLERAGGIQISRAENFIAFALGRKDFEQYQAENAERQRRHRDKLKAEKIEREKAKASLPKPEPGRPLRNGQNPRPQKPPSSAAHLREFESACKTYLPQLTTSDLKKADELFCRLMAKLTVVANKKAA